MDWITLITTIIAEIQKCRQTQSDAQIFDTMRSGGLQTRFILRRIAREQGMSRRETNDFVRDSLNDLEEADDNELKSVMRQAGCSI